MKSNVTDDKEVQFLDDNQENKKKKRKKDDSSLNGMQELGFSKRDKKRRKDNVLKNNEGEESQHGECNEFKSSAEKDDCQYKEEEEKRKKMKKQSEESKSKVYNEFESNEGGDDQGKKMKKKKTLSEESKSKEYNEYESNRGEDDGQGKMKKRKLGDKRKNENGEFNSIEGDPSSVKKAKPDTGESPNTAHSGSSKPKRVTFSDQVEVCCDRIHVKDASRRIKSTQTQTGRWTQEEYKKLFDLVNQDLRVRASQGYRKVRHGMFQDNIGWEAIGDRLVTRNSQGCCHKWYDQLTSPMVVNGVWSDTDDYHLVNALLTLDACCFDEVDWDNLLEHRPGDICRKRWNQMVQCIGEHGRKSFAEQVEILGKRYCPDFLEAREAFDAKPVVC